MRILFVYPNHFGMNMLPTAIGMLNGMLKKEGHQTALFDTTSYTQWGHDVVSDKLKEERLNARPFNDTLLRQDKKASLSPEGDFIKCVQSFSPDLIALSLVEDNFSNAVELLRVLPAKDRPPVLAGGVFPTFAPELCLRLAQGLIDYVLIGEGEATMSEFCRRIERGEDLSSITGLWFFNKDGSIHSSSLPTAVDMNRRLLPDYDFFEESRFYRPMQGKVWRMFPIETHRGCPFTCAYCNSPSQNVIYADGKQKFFRKKPIALIRDEIVHMITKYKADSLYFWADTFLAWTDEEFAEFCEMYADFKLPFWIQTRPETVTWDKFKRLKDVGILRAAFGVEHGDPEFREKVLFRKIDNAIIVNNLNILYDLGVPFSVNNIMGFPRETRELAFHTIELNRDVRSDGMNAYSFTPFHGTPLRSMAEMLGYVKSGEIARSLMNPTMLNMPHWPAEAIEGLRRCFVLYVKLPKNRWPEVEKAEKLTPEGDRVWEELRDDVLANYMSWGDRESTDEVGKVALKTKVGQSNH
jgi:anaerobic magnesium-protoporphyrin IX monomethyl ester cyclase